MGEWHLFDVMGVVADSDLSPIFASAALGLAAN